MPACGLFIYSPFTDVYRGRESGIPIDGLIGAIDLSLPINGDQDSRLGQILTGGPCIYWNVATGLLVLGRLLNIWHTNRNSRHEVVSPIRN